MTSPLKKLSLLLVILACNGCVIEPVDAGPPPPAYGYPAYGYYGYGPVYPWYSGINIDIARGYGHGGYYRGYGGGYRGGSSFHGGGHR